MLEQQLLELARVDVVALVDEHVLLAVDDGEVAVLVDRADVAGAQPAVLEHLGRGLDLVVVTAHHLRAADADLALDEGHLGVEDRYADRAHLAYAGPP